MEGQRQCDFCGQNLADRNYREVTGIEELRSAGGANKVIHRRETGRVPCAECVVKWRFGLNIDQGQMQL